MAGALPGPATALALRDIDLRGAVPVVALGKAAPEMLAAVDDALRERGVAIARALVVAAHEDARLAPPVEAIVGDHPLPGRRSARAARRLGTFVRETEGEAVLVLLSGGTSSLVGAPVDGVTASDYRALCAALLASGLDIVATNAIRKRFSRWGAGRLARALRPRRVICLALSDVPGDDVATIGSGPCVPDALTAAAIRRLVRDAGLPLPPSCDAYLARVERGAARETPKPGDRDLQRARTQVIAGETRVLIPPQAEAERRGHRVVVDPRPLHGDAAEAGRTIARALMGDTPDRPTCILRHGETTVRLPPGAPPGGRCQELALAAAEVLRGAPHEVVLLAAGTDGRDGPTDAAGAVVDGTTWEAIRGAGIDPSAALAAHDAHRALDAVGALIRTGATGTNVGDVVVAIARGSTPSPAR